jgi:hypothetical protein
LVPRVCLFFRLADSEGLTPKPMPVCMAIAWLTLMVEVIRFWLKLVILEIVGSLTIISRLYSWGLSRLVKVVLRWFLYPPTWMDPLCKLPTREVLDTP